MPRPALVLLASGLLIAGALGCAAPDTFLRRVDEQRTSIGRGLVDVIDAADRSFGESRVEDAERIVQVRIGPDVTVRENEGVKFRLPLRLRAPLPALERWANVFLQFDTIADAFGTLGDLGGGLDQNKAFTLSWLSKITERTDTGVKTNLHWSHGPQWNVRPFLRWDYRADGWRVEAEQSAFWDTGWGIGGRTLVVADRRLGQEAFGRFTLQSSYYEELRGVDWQLALTYRRVFIGESFLSGEAGLLWNPHVGPTGRDKEPDPDIPIDEQDGDEVYARVAMAGTVWRPWIEYEFGPEIHFPWRHADTTEFAFWTAIRLVYEDYLRKR